MSVHVPHVLMAVPCPENDACHLICDRVVHAVQSSCCTFLNIKRFRSNLQESVVWLPNIEKMSLGYLITSFDVNLLKLEGLEKSRNDVIRG